MVLSREEWLKERTTGIGGSDASVILKISPWKSQIELWTEKTTGVLIEKEGNSDLAFGKWMESHIIEEYIRRTDKCIKTGFCEYENMRSKEYPFMKANLDAVIVDDIKGLGVLEVKTKGAFVDWGNFMIPDYYISQMQHYFAVTGFTYGTFVVLDLAKKDLIIKDVERDDKFIENLIKEEEKFWNLVINKIPPEPEPTDACESFLKETYKKSEPISIDISSNQVASAYAEQLHKISIEKKNLKQIELECKTFFMNLMKNAEKAIGINYSITWKNDKDSSEFDEKKFKEENPDIYKKYLNPKKGSKRFTFKYQGD